MRERGRVLSDVGVDGGWRGLSERIEVVSMKREEDEVSG